MRPTLAYLLTYTDPASGHEDYHVIHPGDAPKAAREQAIFVLNDAKNRLPHLSISLTHLHDLLDGKWTFRTHGTDGNLVAHFYGPCEVVLYASFTSELIASMAGLWFGARSIRQDGWKTVVERDFPGTILGEKSVWFPMAEVVRMRMLVRD